VFVLLWVLGSLGNAISGTALCYTLGLFAFTLPLIHRENKAIVEKFVPLFWESLQQQVVKLIAKKQKKE
jgi:hypothetical protein